MIKWPLKAKMDTKEEERNNNSFNGGESGE